MVLIAKQNVSLSLVQPRKPIIYNRIQLVFNTKYQQQFKFQYQGRIINFLKIVRVVVVVALLLLVVCQLQKDMNVRIMCQVELFLFFLEFSWL